MPTPNETVADVLAASTWDERVARIRLIPQHHGTGQHAGIYAAIARQGYVPHLAPDFAFVHEAPFYELPHFQHAYDAAYAATNGFTLIDAGTLMAVIEANPVTLLAFRLIVGLTRDEFAHSTALVAPNLHLAPLTASKVDGMERNGTSTTRYQAWVAAETINQIMAGTLFGQPPAGLRVKQDKPDTESGWASVQAFAANGVPYATFLNQRHYGGAFRQVLDATSTQRGNLIEDAVADLFHVHKVPFIRTGSHNQAEVEQRYGIKVAPAPDFVCLDGSDTLRAMLECKGASDGGTARDKALRFERLRAESIRLGGVPLFAVLGGIGWARVNDTLGPVIRDADGRVFTLATLPEMMTVAPFTSLTGLA